MMGLIRLNNHKAVKLLALSLFCLVGWLQQQYVKRQKQAFYEARCAEIAANPAHLGSFCTSATPTDIPLPAQG